MIRHLRLLRHRVRSVFRRQAVEDELRRELNLHLEQLTCELMADGLGEEDARHAARRAFGPPDVAKERCRDARHVGLLEDFVRDVRYACRLLARAPGFTTTAVLSLALGIGANTAIFSLVDAVLLRSLPVVRPHELVFLQSTGTAGPSGAPPYPCFERFRAETTAFAGMAAFATDELRGEVDGTLEQVFGQVASGNYFEVLGLKPTLGRLLTVADERLDPPVAVIGYGYWHRRFGGDPGVIGRTLSFHHRTYTIVGVAPPEFWGLQPGRQVDVTIPITQEVRLLTDAGNWWFDVIARLRPGVSRQQAAAQVDTIFQSFMKGRDQSGELRTKYFDHMEAVSAGHGMDRLRARFSRPLYALAAVTVLVLLIACVNLGTLLFVRGAAREHELAIRLATGAGAGRVVRQLLTETLLLFLLGAVSGLAVAQAATRGLTGFFAIGRNPIQLDVHLDWTVAAYAAAIAAAAGLLTGVWPALRAVRLGAQSGMKGADARLAGSRRDASVARWLVAGQVAMSLVLLVASAMFVKTMVNLRGVDLGFSATRVLTMSLDPVVPDEGAAAARERFWARVLERVQALPGVRAASLSVLTPLSGRDTGKLVVVPSFHPRGEMDQIVHVNHVSSGYFRTFGIPIVEGRSFEPRDTKNALEVAIVNEAAAAFYFAGRNPIGATLRFDGSEYQVIGVVRDAKHLSVREQPPRFAFIPLSQALDNITRITLAVASHQPPATLARDIRRAVEGVHSKTLISDVIDVQEQIDATLLSERLLSSLAAWFAALALGLAAIGLYGVLSYSVARRRAELGVRLALGASPARIAWGVFHPVFVQLASGLAIGVPAALAVARMAGGLLFGVTPDDPASYAFGVAMLTAVACVAAWLPARRACAIDPCEALRRE